MPIPENIVEMLHDYTITAMAMPNRPRPLPLAVIHALADEVTASTMEDTVAAIVDVVVKAARGGGENDVEALPDADASPTD